MIKNPTVRIILFILLMVPAIIVVKIFDLSFLYFALYAVVISLFFPIYFYTLDQGAVDFWYYTLGVLGVVILFSSQTLVTKTYELSNVIAQAKGRSVVLESLKKDVYGVLVHQNGHNIRFELLELFERKHSEYSSMLQNCGQELNTQMAECDRLTQEFNAISRLVNAENIENQLLEINKEDLETIFDGESITFYDVDIPAINVIDLLNPNYRTDAETELIQIIDLNLDSRNQWMLKKQSEIEREFGSISKERKFLSTIWPYLLCIALCMKLARNRYIEML